MDRANVDVEVLEVPFESQEGCVAELQELQLALVGGGIGDTTR
jgi:hypothetical protein